MLCARLYLIYIEGIMKKVLLTTAAALAFSSAAFADMDQFYLTGGLNVAKFNKVTANGNSHKAKFNSIGLDFGVGTNVMDNMRAELVFNYVAGAKLKYSKAGANSTVKPSAQALLVRGLVDFADLGPAKLFAGVGVGVAKASAKFSTTGSSAKAKAKNTLAWSAHLGCGFDVADGVKADLGYSYRDFGKTKAFGGVANNGKATLRSHNLSAGVRFDI